MHDIIITITIVSTFWVVQNNSFTFCMKLPHDKLLSVLHKLLNVIVRAGNKNSSLFLILEQACLKK